MESHGRNPTMGEQSVRKNKKLIEREGARRDWAGGCAGVYGRRPKFNRTEHYFLWVWFVYTEGLGLATEEDSMSITNNKALTFSCFAWNALKMNQIFCLRLKGRVLNQVWMRRGDSEGNKRLGDFEQSKNLNNRHMFPPLCPSGIIVGCKDYCIGPSEPTISDRWSNLFN